MAETSARAGRRKQPLTRGDVLRAAVSFADADGLAALSMRRLAERLGVEAMSLYHHVANKDAILDGMVDAVFAEMTTPPAGQGWQEALRVRCGSAREVLKRHRWAIGLLDSRTNPGPETLRHHDAVIGCLRAGGFSVAGAAHAFAVLDSFVYGFTLQEVSMPFEASGAEFGELAEEMLEQMPRQAYPHLTELTLEHALQPGYAFADEFEIGLDLVLEGLARRRERWG